MAPQQPEPEIAVAPPVHATDTMPSKTAAAAPMSTPLSQQEPAQTTIPATALPAVANVSAPSIPAQDVAENPGFVLAENLPAPPANADLIAASYAPDAGVRVPGAPDSAYTLGIEDQVHLIVYGENDLTGDYTVGPTGTISVPLIGEVLVNNLSLRQAEQVIATRLADGYLVDPSVSMQIAKRRPFYIMGEVRTPGSYSFVSNMTVMNAVAMAGGFTYRANQSSVEIMRPDNEKSDDGKGVDKEASMDARVAPGDIIVVKERFF